MESSSRVVLKHKETGLYFSRMADHTKSLKQAMRWLDEEQCEVWLHTSHYAPDRELYEIVPIKIHYEEDSHERENLEPVSKD